MYPSSVSKQVASRANFGAECASEFEMMAKRSSADRRVFMGGSEESPVSNAKTCGSNSSKHSSKLSKPDSEPRPQMRCPDMGGHEEHVWTDVQAYGQQIMAIEPQDGPPVRLEIPNGPQAAIEHFSMPQIGKHDQVVHLRVRPFFL